MPLPPNRFRRGALACSCVFAVSSSYAQAETWKFEPLISAEETLTNNVNLESNANRRSDWVTQLTPGFRVTETGAHTTLSGFVSVPVLLYARTGSENNKVDPQVSLFGNAELVDRFLFVEGSVLVTQQYLTPFGARSDSLANATENRYTSQVYRVTPYIKGSSGSDYSYELRDNNIWTNGNANLVTGSYMNELVGTFQRDPRPLGWAVDVNRTDTKFQGQSGQLMELARARGLYDVDPQVRLSASAGYEHNDLLIESKNNPIYGIGARWRPTQLTNVDASWEHRFFGGSYNFAFDHRTPLSVWSLVASRNVTSLPQQLASLPAGIDVAGALNQLFLSRITDPVQRQTLINQLIQDRGLPLFLSSPVNLYTQQIQLQESLIGTVGLLGARSNLFFSAYRHRVEPITGSGNVLPDLISSFADNTQYGGSVIWSHSLTPLVSLTGSVDGSRTAFNSQPGTTRQGAVRVGITSPVSTLTSVYAGIRYQILRSNVTNDYDEAAVFVGVNHRFH